MVFGSYKTALTIFVYFCFNAYLGNGGFGHCNQQLGVAASDN